MSGMTLNHDGQDLALTLNGVNAVQGRFLRHDQLDLALAEENPLAGPGTLWQLGDHQGSVRDAVDDTGSVVGINYDSYGNGFGHQGYAMEPGNIVSMVFGYTGQAYDPESGLYHMQHRQYDPLTGQFISQDPAGFEAGDSNLYRYVYNSPLIYTDPTGLSGTPFNSQVTSGLTGPTTVKTDFGFNFNPVNDSLSIASSTLNSVIGNSWSSGPSSSSWGGSAGGGGFSLGSSSVFNDLRVSTSTLWSAVDFSFSDGLRSGGFTATNVVAPTVPSPAMPSDPGLRTTPAAPALVDVRLNSQVRREAEQQFFQEYGVSATADPNRRISTGIFSSAPAVEVLDQIYHAKVGWYNDRGIQIADHMDQAAQLQRSINNQRTYGSVAATYSDYAVAIDAGLRSGAKTGVKAVGNAVTDTVVSTASLGFVDNVQMFTVTSEDMANGYNLSYGIMRTYSEVAAGFALGGASKAAGTAGKAAFAWDMAGNAMNVGRGTVDAYSNGLGWQNGIQMVGGAAGLTGNLTGALRATSKLDVPTAARLDIQNISARNGIAPTTTLGTICFVAGTSVLQGDGGRTGIESIRVGQRVATDGGLSNSGAVAADPDATAVDPRSWRLVTIQAEQAWADGTLDRWEVETLQPAEWLALHQADAGGWIDLSAVLDLAEMGAPAGLRGQILSVGPTPAIEAGPGRVVLTTVSHLNGFVFELTLRNAVGEIDTLGVTGYHRFFDETDGWQQVVELQLGDVLRTQAGPVEVLAIARVAGTHRVYNMTVEADHVYYVGELTTLAHNNGCGQAHPIRSMDLDTFEGFSQRGRSIVGDGLEGHELLQHAWLKHNGHATYRLSTVVSKKNPVIALPRPLHTRINAAQAAIGFQNQSAIENVLANRRLLLSFGVDAKKVNKLTSRAVRHAQEFDL